MIEGPFAETKELSQLLAVAGEVFGEAIEGSNARPLMTPNRVRQVFEAEDFGDEFTPELREQEERVRAQVAAKQ